MPLCDVTNRLRDDDCAVRMWEQGNRDMLEYRMGSLCKNVLDCDDDDEKVGEAWADCRRARYGVRRSVGLNRCRVDDDSRLRLDAELTNGAAKLQLPKRVFFASPDLARGRGEPGVEHALFNGLDTSVLKACDRLAERDFDRFDPGVRCVSVKNIIPTWVRGGEHSRITARCGKKKSSKR